MWDCGGFVRFIECGLVGTYSVPTECHTNHDIQVNSVELYSGAETLHS